MNEQQLELAIEWFDIKVQWLEGHYKEQHKDDFSHDKMRRYVNRKLQKEMEVLVACNILRMRKAKKKKKQNQR